MAELLITGDRGILRSCCYTTSQISLNTMHWRVTGHVGTGATDVDLADAVDLFQAGNYTSIMPTTARWRGVGVKKLLPFPGIETAATARDAAGVSVTEILPTQVSGIITLRTIAPGPGWRGRNYPGFPPESANLATGLPDPAYTAVLAAIGAYWLTEITIGVLPNQSTVIFGLRKATIGGFDVHRWVAVTTWPKWATQRRRGAYGRPNVLPF